MDEITPHVVFTLFNIPVRDTVTTTWIMIGLIILLSIVINRRQPAVLETLVDFLQDTVSDVMGRPAEPFLPFLGSLAIFIAVANIIDIIPLLNSPTRDINTPLALALVVFFSVHYFGIRSRGLLGYLKSLASPIFLLPLEIIGQLSRNADYAPIHKPAHHRLRLANHLFDSGRDHLDRLCGTFSMPRA